MAMCRRYCGVHMWSPLIMVGQDGGVMAMVINLSVSSTSGMNAMNGQKRVTRGTLKGLTAPSEASWMVTGESQ
jgi:hypothetical protein